MTTYGYLTIDLSKKTITSIDKEYKGELKIEKTYGGTVIEIIGTGACSSGNITSLDLSSTSIITIKANAFLRCYNLISIQLPQTLITIGGNAFGVSGLTSFHLTKNVISFSGHALNQSPNLNILTVDKDNLNFASDNNFIFTKDFTELVRGPINFQYENIPKVERINQINPYSLSGCIFRTFVATSNLSNLETYAFHACFSLKYVDLSLSSITTIVTDVFRAAMNIKVLILPRKLQTLDINSIQSLNYIKELIIPETVKSISVNTSMELLKLRHIYVLGSYYSGFENKEIFNGFCDKSPSMKVHVSDLYNNDKFGGFTVTKDLYQALKERMKLRLICTKQKSQTQSIIPSILFFIFISSS